MRQDFTNIGRSDEYKIEPLLSEKSCGSFRCKIAEYNDYLANDAFRSMSDHIALTWLLTERSTGKVAAYMSSQYAEGYLGLIAIPILLSQSAQPGAQ
jgi:hypothetical protein